MRGKAREIEERGMTWDELANLYDLNNIGGKRARQSPNGTLIEWAAKHPELVKIVEDGSVHRVKPREAKHDTNAFKELDKLGRKAAPHGRDPKTV
jgi:hypothetical protein